MYYHLRKKLKKHHGGGGGGGGRQWGRFKNVRFGYTTVQIEFLTQ